MRDEGTMTPQPGLLLGAYAMAPADPAEEERLYAGEADLSTRLAVAGAALDLVVLSGGQSGGLR